MTESSGREKLDIPKTRSEKAWDLIGLIIYVGIISLLIFVWDQLPTKMPAHYDASGTVDRWGSKNELFLLPIIGFFILIFMNVLEKRPHIHNYPGRLKKSNARAFYLNSRKLLNQIKNICLLLFSFILFESISIGMEWGTGFGKLFLPLTILVTAIPIILALWKRSKIQ